MESNFLYCGGAQKNLYTSRCVGEIATGSNSSFNTKNFLRLEAVERLRSSAIFAEIMKIGILDSTDFYSK